MAFLQFIQDGDCLALEAGTEPCSQFLHGTDPLTGVYSIQPVARKVHLVVSYLGFVLMAVHIGLHGNMIMGMAGKIFHRPFKIWKWGKVLLSFMIAGYGVHAVIKREISSYILLKNQFVFFDFKEPIVFFYLDYIAIMGLFILIGNFICSIMRIIDQKSHAKSL